MGREIIFEVRKDNKTIWPEEGSDLFVCGRDDATQFMANYVMNHMPDDADEDTEPVVLISLNDPQYYSIREELENYYNKDLAEIQKAKDTLYDLREARRHANYEDFFKFSESIKATQDWIDENDYWSRAGSMLEYLDKCYDHMQYLIDTDQYVEGIIDRIENKKHFQVAIIWSE